MVRSSIFLLAISVTAVAACSSESTQEPNDSPDAGVQDTLDSGAGSSTHAASAALLRCAIGRRQPTSIVDAITRINALLPADGPCIIASLPRPLAIVATRGMQSVQPAQSAESPRIFFLTPKLVVAAVPSGSGSRVLEFGEWSTTSRTTKGEIGLPVTTALASDAAFARVANSQGSGTTCALSCHHEERPGATVRSFVSSAFQPQPNEIVSVAQLSAFHDKCTKENDTSDRCAMLHAVFDVGPVTEGSFGSDVGFFP